MGSGCRNWAWASAKAPCAVISAALMRREGNVGSGPPDSARARLRMASSMFRKPLLREGVSTAGPSCSSARASGSTCTTQ